MKGAPEHSWLYTESRQAMHSLFLQSFANVVPSGRDHSDQNSEPHAASRLRKTGRDFSATVLEWTPFSMACSQVMASHVCCEALPLNREGKLP